MWSTPCVQCFLDGPAFLCVSNGDAGLYACNRPRRNHNPPQSYPEKILRVCGEDSEHRRTSCCKAGVTVQKDPCTVDGARWPEVFAYFCIFLCNMLKYTLKC